MQVQVPCEHPCMCQCHASTLYVQVPCDIHCSVHAWAMWTAMLGACMGTWNERPPDDHDWTFLRLALIVRIL